MLAHASRAAIAAPRRVLAIALLVIAATAVFGVPVAESLSAGGMRDPSSESALAARLLADRFDQGDMAMIVSVTAPEGAEAPAPRAVAEDIVAQLQKSPHVSQVTSAWAGPPGSALYSEDGTAGLIIAGISGDDNQAQRYAQQLAEAFPSDHPGVTVRTGGEATIYWQINEQTLEDLLVMESLAMPLSFVVLVWVFGGLVAAAIPMVIGIFAISGALAVLRLVTLFTDVSIFALNLTIALGLALAIDYTLLILSRYRDELAEGAARPQALRRTMSTAGRTVLFSATTVASSMVAMVLFPQYFLKSFAYAGIAVVLFAAAASIVVTPALIVLLGDRLDALDIRRLLRRRTGPGEQRKPIERTFWYRTSTFVTRHAVPVGAAVIALLLLLGAPFLGVRWGFPDDRMLPESASARQLGEQLRNDFAANPLTDISVLVSDDSGLDAAELSSYAAAVSRVPDVVSVAAPDGTYVAGERAGPPTGAAGIDRTGAFLTVSTDAPLFSEASTHQLEQLHATAAPPGATIRLAGVAQANHDSVHAITARVPLVLGVIAAITLVLLFLLTGSVVLPVKAVLLNILSLTAAFGALVWVFQDGHLGALGAPVTGTLEVNLPVLLFCIAFGLSMDYEVFLISRIREFWLASERTAQDNTRSVALGVAHTGRVITAAALVMSISFAALMVAHVFFMRMFGLGLTLAVLMDATLVRMLLVPAFMRVLGRLNWWAPAPLARLHARIGLSDSAPPATAQPAPGDEVRNTGSAVV
ncbi:MMPL family transporter [Mycolicibacterium palauense]|uniref:MMPL family transporter n=1 Tax=Mycolicibacterium palauense TaxID=2034511 RepID=UPI000BFF01F6|nr:MMPL family transporter [Mycolicibacterium palauense]